MLLFLQLYLSHLVADFLLQPNWIARNKKRVNRLLLHSVIHVATTAAIINIALTKKVFAAVLILAISHAICDYIKAKFTKDEWLAFTADQIVHFFIITVLSIWLSMGGWENAATIAHLIGRSQ